MKTLKPTRLPRRSPLVIAVAGALVLLMSGTAAAQQATTPPPADVQPDAAADEATTLDTVTVTANKRAENIREVAASISVINEEKIENLHATQLSDFQALVPGLYVSTNGAPGKTQLSLRGVAPLSSGATVGTYLDETPLGSSGIYQAANFFALDLLPYDIGRIEVLRGPQGTLYGAGSMGGLVKYVTVKPDLSTTSFRVGGGLSNVADSGDLGWNMRFGANLPLVTDSVGLRVSYARNDLPGYIDNSVDGSEDINGGSQTSARAALLWQGESASLDLVAMRQTIDSDNNALVALDPTTQEPLYGDLQNNVFVDETFFKDVDYFSATVDWNLGWADFVSATAYSDSESVIRQDTTQIYGEFANMALGLPEQGSSYFDIGLDLTKFSQEFRLVSKATGPFEWMVGGFYTKEDAKQTQTLKLNQLDGSPLPPGYEAYGTLVVLEIPSTYKETAVFANGAWTFNDVFKLNAGIRYAQNDQDFSQNVTEGVLLPPGESPGSSSEGVFTWSLSPQFQLSEDAMLYARVATGYQPGGPNIVVAGLPSAVGSSTLTNYEIGLKSQFADRRVLFDVTGFYIDWSDIQVASVVNGISGLVNAGKASSKGIELSTGFLVTDAFSLGLNAAYTDSRLDEDYPLISIPGGAGPGTLLEITSGLAGDVLPYVPKWSWTATGDYDFQLDKGWAAHFGAALHWVGDRSNGTTTVQQVFDDTTVPPTLALTAVTPPLDLDSYWSLDLNASLSNENWTLRAYAKNLTDERGYQSIGDITSAVTGATAKLNASPIQPRTLGIEVDYRF
jgi:outer membrane receptor protein involved in Fe transport